MRNSFYENRRNGHELSKWLETFDWDYFAVATTSYNLSSQSARRLAEKLFTVLTKKEPSSLFYTVEPFYEKGGCHIHMLFQTKATREQLNAIYQYISGAKNLRQKFKFDIEKYEAGKKGCNYILKHYGTSLFIDYDFLYTSKNG